MHAVTIAAVRFPAFFGGIARQFVLGPIGGGEAAPTRLSDGMGLRIAIRERLHHLANWTNRYDPLMRATFKSADVVLVKSAENAMAIPRRYRSKCIVHLGIGIDERDVALDPLAREHGEEWSFRVLYAGRHVHWKGMEFGLREFARLLRSYPIAGLSLAGEGPAQGHWRKLATELGVADHITWLAWRRYEDMHALHRSHHVFLFPSLHEPSGMAVVEALAASLPVVCFKLCGPGVLVDDHVGRAVDVFSATNHDEAVDRLAAALLSVAALGAEAYRQLSRNAIAKTRGLFMDACKRLRSGRRCCHAVKGAGDDRAPIRAA